MKNRRAVILLSGGLDSATAAAMARSEGYDLFAMTFLYGQRHAVEQQYAKKLALYFSARDHVIVEIPSRIFRSALLQGSDTAIPRNQDPLANDEIPVTYVPARNILFLSYALAYAESISAESIYIGANAIDYSGYPDCRPEFFAAFQAAANLGTKAGVSGSGIRIMTPLINLKKSEIIARGTALGVDYSMTHSCYDPGEDGVACGVCDSCILRRKGFAEAGIPDPVPYRKPR